MIETIQLKITSPAVKLPGLEDAIKGLTTLDELLDRVSKRPTVNIQGFSQIAQGARAANDTVKLLIDNLERAGQSGAAGRVRGGFKSLEEEAERLNVMRGNLEIALRKSPGGAALANPAIANQVDALQNALASVKLRQHEISGARSDVAAQVGFDREASALEAAEKKVAGTAGVATQALRTQGEVVLRKTEAMGGLATESSAVAAAETEANVAAHESNLISERYITKKGEQKLAERQFQTGIGETSRVMGESGEVVIDNINHLEKYRDALRKNTVEFANRRVGISRGSSDEAQLLRAEAEEIDKLAKRFGGFVGTAEQQKAEIRAAALRRRAVDIESRRLPETINQQRVSEFERRASGYGGERETSSRSDITGRVERTTLRRDNAGMKEAITLTQQFDAQGKLLNATLQEQSKHVDNLNRTTQSSLLGTVSMAAKFIAIYRGIDLVIQGLEAGIHSTIEFERRVATLSIVYHGTAEEARQLAIEVLNQASALGQDGVAALEVATDFARFGLRQTEVLEAVRVSMVAANVAQLDLAQSGKYLQAIYSGYQLNVGQLAGVLGSLDTVSHSYNVTNTQLLDGLSRVAPLAKQAGVGLNELIGYEAVISGRTARPGSEAGNAIKALISRLAKPTTQTALADIAGVDVKDQAGELKAASQIINELYVSYQDLSRAEQQELLIKLAGTQQASRIAALLDDYLKSQELAIRASRDLGRAERENIAVRKTLSSQLGTAAAEWQKFWVASASPNLAGGVQGNLIEMVKNLSNVLSILSATETAASKFGGGRGGSKEGRFAQGIIDTISIVNPFDLGGKARVGNRQFDNIKEFLDHHGWGDVWKSESDKATEGLIQFNKEIDRVEKFGEADSAAARVFRTAGKLIDTASPDKLEGIFRITARSAAPTDLRKQEQIRAELNALQKSGDYLGIQTRLSELAKEADADRATQLVIGNKRLDERIDRESKELKLLNEKREAAGRGGNETEADRLDKEIDEKENQISELNRRRTKGFKDLFPEGEDPYGFDPDAVKKRSDSLETHFKGLTDVAQAFPKTTDHEVEELDRQLDLIKQKGREIDRERLATVEAAQARRTDVFARTEGDVTGADADKKTEALKLREETERVQQKIISDARQESNEQRETLRVEEEKLNTLRQYAQLQDAIHAGARRGRNEVEQFKIGRNETEQLFNEVGGIERLLPSVVNRARSADPRSRAASQAEALELTNRLNSIGESIEERRFRLKAEYVNELRKENEEVSKSLQLANREEQVRAALVARFVQNRGGRGFSENEFQFLDQKTRESILKFNPNSAPASVPTRSHELAQEIATLEKRFEGVMDIIRKTVGQIQAGVGRDLTTNPNQRGITVPGGFTLPAINIDVRDQFAQMTRYLGDVVTARFDTELAGIRAEVRDFIGSQRINTAQSAATGAI